MTEGYYYLPQSRYADNIFYAVRNRLFKYTHSYDGFLYRIFTLSKNAVAEFGAVKSVELNSLTIEMDDFASFKQQLKQLKEESKKEKEIRLEALVNLEDPIGEFIEALFKNYGAERKVVSSNGKYAFLQNKPKTIKMLF